MRVFTRGLRIDLFSLLAVLLATPALADDHPSAGSAIVLFDQSGSMGRFDPLAISKIWLLTFSKAFADPRQVQLVGFDEDFHDPVNLEIGPQTNQETINRTVEKMQTKGKVTDLESPFRYLSTLENLDAIDLILIITDGEPEIWDTKLGYLSARAQDDPRYVDLNDLYEQLRKNQDTTDAQYEFLKERFHQRNLELIEERIAGLAPEIGKKLIFWDISGQSSYLKKWAQSLEAEYMGARIAAQEDPVGQLQKALGKLQAQTSVLISQPLPEDHETQIETVLATVEEVQEERAEEVLKQATAPAPPEPLPEPEPEPVPVPEPDTQPQVKTPVLPLSSEGKQLTAILLLTGLMFFIGSISWLVMRSRRQDIVSVPSKILSNPLVDYPADKEESEARGERRFAVRVAVPDGAMSVKWINQDGSTGQGAAINVSLHGLLFEAQDFDAEGIDQIHYPSADIDLKVAQSHVVRRDDASVAVVIDKFHNNIDNWMKWVGLLTRINKEE
jgi:hypothetical protein